MLGADGFIGSHITRLAAAAGIDVVAICVSDPWRISDVEGIERHQVPDGRWWERAFGDQLGEWLRGAGALALMAYSPPTSRYPQAWTRHEREVNLGGVRRVVERASAEGVRVVFASSADVYGSWHDDPVAEEIEARPATPYAEAKRSAEEAVRSGSDPSSGSSSLRLATVYGPGEDGPRAIPSFIRACLRGEPAPLHGDGADVRDYVNVRDVGAAFLAACGAADLGDGEPINIGSGIGRSTREVLEAVAAATRCDPHAEQLPSTRAPSRLVLRCERARELLGFEPRVTFDDGLDEEVGWLRQRYGEAQ